MANQVRVTIVKEPTRTVEVSAPGPQGPPGESAAPVRFEHIQSAPSTFWPIAHLLGYFPHVTVIVDDVDVSDGVVVTHIDENNATVSADVAIAGKAECS